MPSVRRSAGQIGSGEPGKCTGREPASTGSAWASAPAPSSAPVIRAPTVRGSWAYMVNLVLGIGAAIGASTLYSLGIALQAVDAKQAPHEEHLRLALAWGLARRARWLAGTGLSVLGWALQIRGLRLA